MFLFFLRDIISLVRTPVSYNTRIKIAGNMCYFLRSHSLVDAHRLKELIAGEYIADCFATSLEELTGPATSLF